MGEYPTTSNQSEIKIPIGISSCLLGQKVRYDGGHKRDRYITDTLGDYFRWVAVCPEMELGLGAPRPSISLHEAEGVVRLMQPDSGDDHTESMNRYAVKRVAALKKEGIFGYILKSRSPSCGKGGVKIYKGHGIRPLTNGVGLFASCLQKAWPQLPVEDEGRLCDPALRENWVAQVFAFYAFQTHLKPRATVGKLVAFHTRYKFTILSHCNSTYQALGRLVANAKGQPINEVVANYEFLLMTALKKRATTAKHTNVMLHLLGFFKLKLGSSTRRQILESIEDYGNGIVPLIVPVTLIRHYAINLEIEYLLGQAYLNPHPKELALRSRI